MNALAESGGGLILVLSLVLLWQRRLAGTLAVLALQCTLAALMAACQAVWPVAGLELAWCVLGLPWLLWRSGSPAWSEPSPATLASAAVVGAVCLPLGAIGPGLAVALLGALLITVRSGAAALVVGLGSMQAGIVAAGLVAGQDTALLAAPCLPLIGLALCGGIYASRRPRGWLASRFTIGPVRELRDADFIGCALLLLAACAMPVLGLRAPGPWLFAAPGLLTAVLFGLIVAALRWPRLRKETAASGTLLTVGAFVAALAAGPVLAWIGLAAATAVALPPRRRRLAGIGLGLTLFGSIILHVDGLPACVTMLAGLGCLAALGPEMAVLSALFLLRLRAELGVLPGLDPVLMTAGLLAVACPVLLRPACLTELITLGQAGSAVFALGLHVPGARFAAVLLLVLLALTRLALELAPDGDALPRIAALVGLFPGLALLLSAAAAHKPLLLLPLGAGLTALGWRILRAMPPGPYRLRPSLAWLPLAAVLLIGFVLSGPVGAGLRLVAEQLP